MLQDLAPELSRCEPGALTATKLASLKTVIRTGPETTSGMLNFDAVIESGRSGNSAALDAISATLEPTDAINIQFTSGTTGTPKGATLSHINIVNNGRFVVRAQNMDETDRLCIP